MTNDRDVLEQNVSTLLETGGEPPRISDVGRARIRAELVDKFGAATKVRPRGPAIAVGIGLVATAAAAMLLGRFVGGTAPVAHDGDLADGTTYLTEPGATVAVLGPRHVRVEGAALLDVVPGKGTFVVETARGRIEVLGTRFLVDGEADKTTAAVVRGQVKLATDRGEVVLHAGEQGVAEAGRPPVRGPAPRLSHLVSWARETRRRDERAVEPIHHGTLFARDPGVRSHPPWGQEYPLPIKDLKLDVVVEDQVARVALDQTFHNDADQDLEGVYRFAIPPDAALQRLAMYVDGKLEESAVVERMQARRIYEELVYRRVDPALLEWAGTGRLSLRVYPIPARQDKRLMLAYTQSLPKLYDDWTLTVPLPEVDQPVGELDVAVRVKGCANCELTSTSHHVEVERTGDDAIVRYKRSGERIGDSFVVHVRDRRRATTVATRGEGGDRYLMVRAPVALGTAPRVYRPRTWVILDDVSASRSALELRAQADLVDAFLRELDEDDRISVIAFDVEARQKLAPTRVLDVDRNAIRKSLEGEGGVGATDFGVALDAATRALAGAAPDDAMIVYLGDGVITSGAQKLDELRAKLVGKAHFVGVGVGDGPDTQTLGGLAAATGGYATTIDLADDVGWRAFDLVAALHTARVTALDARLVDATGALVPSTAYLASSQLADGEELELVAKLAGEGTPVAVELTGTVDGAPWHRTIPFDGKPHDQAGYLPRLWAQRHIAARLLAKHEPVVVPPCDGKSYPTEGELREARDEAIRKEIIGLGKRYFLLSRHTSLLVLENDAMYAQYGVAKGAGDTWAPYALPSTIPVPKLAALPAPSDVAEDAELVRAPLQIFYDPYGDGIRAIDESGLIMGETETLSRIRTFGVGSGGGGFATASPPVSATVTRGDLHLGARDWADDAKAVGQLVDLREHAKRKVVSTGYVADKEAWKGGRDGWFTAGPLTAARFTYPTDTAFDDLTALVPALVPDAADAWRARLDATKGDHAIDAAARAILVEARRRLPSGLYRWGELELAVDDARRLGWRRITDAGLGETASYDGAAWTRRYAELGLDVTRAVGDDDVALALAYLPIAIVDPSHYARYFDVTARGAREVALATKSKVAFVLRFDDQYRLVAIASSAGDKLVEITWGPTGPTAARVGGEAVSVGFTGEAIGDAAAWAHAGTQAGVVVELPLHLVAFWQAKVASGSPGSPAWRNDQRQLMASAAATQDRGALFQAYNTLGDAQLGELVLASGGIATASTDEQFAKAVAPFAQHVVGKYLVAGRAYGKSLRPARLAPQTRDGFVGALWQLRATTAQLAAGDGKAAVDQLVAIGPIGMRLIAAAATTNRGDIKLDDLARAWDSVAVGAYRNVARAQAAQALFNRGSYDAGAERVAELVDKLDLDAAPPHLENAMYMFQQSRRGAAGWQIVWATWRDRVLASDRFAHVMALLRLAPQHPADLPRVLARATELAVTVDDKLAVARAAVSSGQGAWAETIVTPLLKASPSRELYQLAASLALAHGQTATALAELEAAQDAGADEAVDIGVVRAELGQLIGVARQLATQTSGADRAYAIRRAMRWGDRWRAVDAGNPAIDEQLGELLLAVGDASGAWRQLSTTIERDPWSGAGYMTVADAFERQGKVADALPYWQQAIVIDQTNPTPRLRKAQALIALGRSAEGDALLHEIAGRKWHDMWSGVVYQVNDLIARGKR